MRELGMAALAVLALIPVQGLHAGVEVRLHEPHPERLGVEHLWWVDITNRDTVTYDHVWLHGEMREARRGLVYRANSNRFDLPPGVTRIKLRDITLRDQWHASGYEALVLRTGTVPEGDYTYSVSLEPELGGDTTTAAVRLPGRPRLISPSDGAKLPWGLERPLFSWTDPMPRAGDEVIYQVRIVQVQPGQTAEQAMKGNQPWLELLTEVPRMPYPLSGRALEMGAEYAWQVQASWGDLDIGTSETGRFSYQPDTLKLASPDLRVTAHAATRRLNGFEVTLSVENQGTGTAHDVAVEDLLRQLQAVSAAAAGPGDPTYEARFGRLEPMSVKCTCRISDPVAIPPGGTRLYTYNAIPILTDREAPQPSIGENVRLTWTGHAGVACEQSFTSPVLQTTASVPFVTAHAQACKTADYLIITCPIHLFTLYRTEETNELLSDMAELAWCKRGVLGYLTWPDRDRLKDRTSPGGEWAAKLHSSFSKPLGGYLLIVGETEIIPAWEEPGYSGVQRVPYSDHPYASTLGPNSPPALIVGRIIGDSAAALSAPIRASIGVCEGTAGYAFNRDTALVISGPGWGSFVRNVTAVAESLSPEFTVRTMHMRDYYHVGHPSPANPFHCYYDPDDMLAVGDVYGDEPAEIVIADAGSGKILVCKANGNQLGSFTCGLANEGFEKGDKIAVGSHSILMADHSADRILAYNWAGIEQSNFAVPLEAADGLALGDVVGDGYAEIVLADASADTVYLYSIAGVKLNQFHLDFEQRDGFAVGDVWGGDADEIVVADRSANRISVYSPDGVQHLQTGDLGTKTTAKGKTLEWLYYVDYDDDQGKDVGGSAIAVGEVRNRSDSPKEEILIAPGHGYSGGFSHVHVYWSTSAGLVKGNEWDIPFEFEAFDGLATGDIGGSTQDEVFVADRDDSVHILSPEDWDLRMCRALPGFTRNTDVVYWSGHGKVNAWGGGFNSHFDNMQSLFDFHGHNPVCLTSSCRTGDYEATAIENRNVAESFLACGGAVYVGSTEECYAPSSEAAEKFFGSWSVPQSVGDAFTGLERSGWPLDDAWKFYVRAYNLYGDPKYGNLAAVLGADGTIPPIPPPPMPTLTLSPPSAGSLLVEVPDYVVTREDGLDHVDIPGGHHRSKAGELWIPYYSVSFEYAKGTRVQDVVLTEKSGLVTDSGLRVPMVPQTIVPSVFELVPYAGDVRGWFPDEEYDWQVTENPDGSTTLVLAIYPVRYNPATAELEFHRSYKFQVRSATSGVAIAGLTTDKSEYRQGDPVKLDAVLENSGEPQDVTARVVVRKYGSDEVVAELRPENRERLSDTAHVSFRWASSGHAPGRYYAEVAVTDPKGDVLDTGTRLFTLGISSAEIADLATTPRDFDVGDTVSLTLTVNNSGTVDISGTAVVKVRDDEGTTVQEHRFDLPGLRAGTSINVEDSWDSRDAEEGASYEVVAYVIHDAGATPFASVSVSAR